MTWFGFLGFWWLVFIEQAIILSRLELRVFEADTETENRLYAAMLSLAMTMIEAGFFHYHWRLT